MGKRRVYNIQVGESFYWSDRKLWHIVHIFEDDGSTMVVMKSWTKYKCRWMYQVVDKEVVEWWFQSGCFKEVNK